ncbi:MAG: methionine--tRNA ligase [Candidatus Wallbacteria bacterium HGW-Wallbacteria-1]|jgi:methionyl-tRNA synthetase|uniref:Methionine--tRNA ligase n=1 Tax=Candidatus Wallbacteria bacterium HGW-Wallbacteria-1 TaxID=2013854 RepID=A0A2N1PTT0_9BACT|nr:MAG: methionine--tRNA ligase [Candidatus Wallbacteria bacterium HGW-Wallbacteria-1]
MTHHAKEKFYLTTAIPFVNAAPHIGFGLEIVQADAVARYNRLMGKDVFFLTGTDENSLKNVQAAEREGTTPALLCDRNSSKFQELRSALNLSNDRFIRTTHPAHVSGCQKLWRMCRPEDIYRKEYRGLYCVGCETFYTEKDLVDGLCPEHRTPPEVVEEENYFFRLSAYQERLEELIESDTIKIVPKVRKNEVLSFIRMGLEDFSISRSVRRAKNWGIPVPDDDSQVMYVWFDALTNYLTGIGFTGDGCEPFDGEALEQRYWPCDLHIIGKGIIRFHAIYWPAMLLSAGISLPKSIFVHGYLTVNGEKISKSLGNVIDPFSLSEKYGRDPVRYYLLRMIPPYADGDFSTEVFEKTYNSDLANDLGNLLNRTLAMVKQNFGDNLPKPGPADENDTELIGIYHRVVEEVFEAMEEYRFNLALESIWTLVRAGNKYIDLTEPWKLAKSPELKPRLATVMYNLCETLGKVALLISPYIPDSAIAIRKALGMSTEMVFTGEREWGKIDAGSPLARPEPLFPRIDAPAKKGSSAPGEKKSKAARVNSGSVGESVQSSKKDRKAEVSQNSAVPEVPVIAEHATIDEFIKLDLTVGQIVEAQPMEGADKLYLVTVDMGTETRVLASGLRPYFTADELQGRKVIVVANLKPRKIRGHLSQGMILASGEGEQLALLSVDSAIPNGTRVS